MERKVALVTGAGKGIGAEIVRTLASSGYAVIINYRNSEKQATTLVSELLSKEINCMAVKADLSIRAEAEYLYEQCVKCFGFVDTVINNAGVSHFGLATEDDEEQYRYVMDCNFGSVFNVSSLFARDMVSNFRGNIINISSVWGQRGSAMESLYSASKSAIIGYTKALHKELIPQNVKVNCLLPGYVKTDMNAQFDEAEEKEILKRMRQKSALLPTDVSRAVLEILRSGVSGKIITQSTPTIKL